MSNRINLDDPNYDHSQRVVVQDNKAKILWVVIGIIAAVLIVVVTLQSGNESGNGGFGNGDSVSKNPHASCKYVGKDREYFAGPMVDVYFNYEHPEWGYHTH